MSSRHKILIVDDDPDDREAIRDAFLENMHQHEYLFIGNSDQLNDHLRMVELYLTIILLDLNLPGKDGRDILKELKESKVFKIIPVIVLTTSSSEKDRIKSYELGASCFITKPASYTELLEVTDCIAKLWCCNK